MPHSSNACARDALLVVLSEPPYRLLPGQICRLEYEDVAQVAAESAVGPSPRYSRMPLQVRPSLRFGDDTQVPMGPELLSHLRDYLQADGGRPFRDYRPDIGRHLFPSRHITGPIGAERVAGILRRQEGAGLDGSGE